MSEKTGLTPSGEKLADVAQQAFYASGIEATGVDAIAALAGISKPTLYAQFGSKRELVAVVLRRLHQQRRASLERYLNDRGGDPREQLLSVFDWLGGVLGEQGARGCAFINAAAEISDLGHPARAAIAAHKRWVRELLVGLARQADLSEPERLGEALQFLIDGVHTRILIDGDAGAWQRARLAAADLIAAHERSA